MCDDLATCSDIVGSYTCTCNSGYTGTGFACNGNHTGNIMVMCLVRMPFTAIDNLHFHY